MSGSRHQHIEPVTADADAHAGVRRALNEAQIALVAGDRVEAFAHLSRAVLDGPPAETSARLTELCTLLEQEPQLARLLGFELRKLLTEVTVGPALVESSMMSSSGFLSELWARLFRRFLAELHEPEDLRAVLRQVFPGRHDHLVVEQISEAHWSRLLSALGIQGGAAPHLDPEVETAIRTLASHAASLGLHPEFMHRLSLNPDLASPFLSLPDRILGYVECLSTDDGNDHTSTLQAALDTIDRCRAEVDYVTETMTERGTSLSLTRITFRLLRLLDRLEVLLRLTDRTAGHYHECVIRLFREVLTTEKTQSHILPHIQTHIDLLAYQVVEHAARKGGKYITSGRRDYARLFLASLGGGAIVAVFSFCKVFLGKLDTPLGIEALLYGLNYSACFVLIYMTGAALATKQPAMTANTIAQALGRRQDRHLEQLEDLVVRVWRSQFVSFAGNLLMALPVAFALSEIFYRRSASTITSASYADSMLAALHPWQSGTLFFAAVAGLFLFLSGLISGWVDNRYIYTDIRQRIARQGTLIRLLGPKRAQAVADYLHRNLGALTGNVFLGFALGSTGTIGEIFGLPLDIRHIAFASSEFGTALEILHFRVAWSIIWPVALGVAVIGLINFVVSFGLSFAVALESRQITWREIGVLTRHLAQIAIRRPMDWFFPPSPKRHHQS